jgi:NADH-quinone oxidoreductase subunit G
MFNYLNLQKEKQSNESDQTNISEKQNFINENLKILFKDYYFSNVVARSSKTMIECNNAKINFKSTGTEG